MTLPINDSPSEQSLPPQFPSTPISLPTIPTIQQSKTSELHQKIAKTAVQLINNNFTPEVLKVSTLTG